MKNPTTRTIDQLLTHIARLRAGTNYTPKYPNTSEAYLTRLDECDARMICLRLRNNATEAQRDAELNHDLWFNIGYRDGLLDAIDTIIDYCEQINPPLDFPHWLRKEPIPNNNGNTAA